MQGEWNNTEPALLPTTDYISLKVKVCYILHSSSIYSAIAPFTPLPPSPKSIESYFLSFKPVADCLTIQ